MARTAIINELNIVKGETLKDLDPRQNGRTVVVTRVTTNHAWYQAGKRSAKIRFDRIVAPGSTKKSGYMVLR